MPGRVVPLPIAFLTLVLGLFATRLLGVVSAPGIRTGLVMGETTFLAPSLLALVLLRRPLGDSLGLRAPGAAAVGLGVLSGAALWAASLGLFEVQRAIVPPTDTFLDAFARANAAVAPSNLLDGFATIVALALVPACCEEIVFRGVLLRSLMASLGPAVAVLGSATLFALMHVIPLSHSVSFYRIPFAFLVGTGLGVLAVRGRSLVVPILAHVVINVMTFLAVMPLAGQDLKRASDPFASSGLPLLVGGAALFVLLLKRATTSSE